MMKNLRLSFLLLSTLSCSDKLSESKVEDLIIHCLEKEPSYGTSSFRTGKTKYITNESLKFVTTLKEQGLVNFEQQEEYNGQIKQNVYIVSLTEKAKPFIIESKENVFDKALTDHTVRLFTYKLDKIGTIKEIPAMNIAEVSITLKKEDKTPFYDILENDKTQFKAEKITIHKTENKGWIYCD